MNGKVAAVGSLFIRENASSVAFIKIKYGQPNERLITVPFQELLERQEELKSIALAISEESEQKVRKYLFNFKRAPKIKAAKKEFLSREQIINFMSRAPEALAQLIEQDPKCKKPENRQLAMEIWKSWTPIRQLLSNVRGWNIKEADSKRDLGWGALPKKENGVDHVE
jgi:hypothetical protein